jgi:hypothetical protein
MGANHQRPLGRHICSGPDPKNVTAAVDRQVQPGILYPCNELIAPQLVGIGGGKPAQLTFYITSGISECFYAFAGGDPY